MTWTLAENAVDKVQEYLKANISTRLSAISTEIGDSLDLPAPTEYILGHHDLDHIDKFPVAYILCQTTNVEMLIAGGKGLKGNHPLQIGIVTLSDKANELRRLVYRYGRALLETLADANVSGNLSPFTLAGFPTITYSPTLTDGSRFLGDVLLEWTVVAQETR